MIVECYSCEIVDNYYEQKPLPGDICRASDWSWVAGEKPSSLSARAGQSVLP